MKWKEGAIDHVHEAEASGPNWVNSKMECLDFDNHASKVVIQNEIKGGMARVEYYESQRIFVYVLVGLLTGIFGSFILLCAEKGTHYKYHYLVDAFNHWFLTSQSYLLFFIVLFSTLLIAMVGTLLVVYIEPKAAGGGLAPVIAYVNGVKVPGALAFKTLIVKTFSLICCMNAGLAAGMEAPMVHVGACVAHSVVNMKIPFTNYQPFNMLHTDLDKRDLVGAGIAAGITGAFSTPIGGALMALEEGTTFFSVGALLRFLLTSVTCAITVNVILSLASHHPGDLTQSHLLFFVVLQEENFHYYAQEFPFYILVGLIGGLFGTLFNIIQIRCIIYRKKYITKKWHQLTEMAIVASATATFYYIMLIAMSNYCLKDQKGLSELIDILSTIQLNCPKEEYSTVSVFFFQAVPNVIRFMFVDGIGDMGVLPLALYVSGFFILSVVTMGTLIAAGIFIPNLAVGASWGRLLGELIKNATGWDWIHPHKYAFLAAGAQLTGVVRVPFTIGVLMMEATGNTKLGYAIFTSLIVSYVIASFFTESIYHHQISMAGMPIVHTDPPPFCSTMTAENLMASPVVTISKKTNVETVRNMLKMTTHNCYPIVSASGVLEGSISRNLLIILMKRGMFEGATLDEDEAAILSKEHLSLQNVKMIEEVPGENSLDLENYMDATPIVVTKDTSFDSIYRLVSCIGCRHIIVVDTSYKVIGIVTRKKLSVYRCHVNFLHASVVKLPLR
ncbi:hypothetical protein GE061_005818 [Apolygus lucorum]|uniref:CBS domain-containing protein n=1 Tax=Apolygus lucorum TaxID=248454 RepID=A0A8S9WWS0_APOLU|nr:hypothetical protein GE061_005818 [Apolygus lucorum]